MPCHPGKGFVFQYVCFISHEEDSINLEEISRQQEETLDWRKKALGKKELSSVNPDEVVINQGYCPTVKNVVTHFQPT